MRASPTVEIELPEDVSTPAGLQAAHAAVLRAVAEGEMPAAVAKDVSAILEAQRRIVETVTLEQRIAALEAGAGGRK